MSELSKIIDPSLSQGVMTRGYNESVDRRNALANRERVNRLADLQYQQELDKENQSRALRSYMANKDPNAPDFEQGLGMIVGPQGVFNYRKQQAEVQKNQAETKGKEFELESKKLDFTLQAVGAASTPEKAMYYITQGLKNGVFSMQEASDEIAELRNITPEGYAQYRMNALQRTLAAKDQLDVIAPKIDQMDTGSSFVATQANRFQPGYGKAMPGMAPTPKTATIGERTAQGNLALAQKKFKFEQDNPGITVQQLENGDLVGVNSRTGQAMPITMGSVAPAASASNAFSPRLPPTAAPAVTQAIPGMPSVLDQRAPVVPVAAAPAVPMAGTPLRGKGAASTTTEGDRKAATLLQRLQFSQGQLTQALVDNPNAAKPGVFTSALDMLSTPLANTLTSEARQRVESAQLDILDAALTLGTGAAYTKEQLEGYRRAYFPQIGDGPTQIEDKKARLENVISAAKIAAGKGAALVPSVPNVSGSRNTVTDPTGMVHTFLTAEAAAAFKKAAGIK
jgi:hypothetical protein